MTSAERAEAAATPLLRDLPADQVERLLAGAGIRRVGKGAMLFEEGSDPLWLCMLLSGSLEAFTSEQGRDCTILIFSRSDVFMPAAAIVAGAHLVGVRALYPSRILLIPAERVREEMARCPVFACRVAQLLAGQARMLMRHIIGLKTRSGPQRLAAFLLRLVDERGVAGSAELPATKGVIASRLGMTPETMSRSLQVIARHGLVVRGHRVFVLDRAKAEQYCGRNPLIDGSEAGIDVGFW